MNSVNGYTYIVKGTSLFNNEICIKVGKVSSNKIESVYRRVNQLKNNFTFKDVEIIHILNDSDLERDLHEFLYLESFNRNICLNEIVLSYKSKFPSKEFFKLESLELIRNYLNIKNEVFIEQDHFLILNYFDLCPDLEKKTNVIKNSKKELNKDSIYIEDNFKFTMSFDKDTGMGCFNY